MPACSLVSLSQEEKQKLPNVCRTSVSAKTPQMMQLHLLLKNLVNIMNLISLIVITAPNKLELAAKKTYDIAKALGYGGFEAYFSKTNGSLAPEAKIPIVAISIAVAIFSIMILGVYWYLRRKEKRRAKKTQVLGYEDKSSYS